MNELVSIIMPTYNQCNYIGRAIESVINQTYLNWELIIIDNYSDDGTDIIINKYDDERIKVFKFSNKGIIAASRNLGIQKSNGDVIAFLDSDDYWKNNKLYLSIKALEHFDIVHHDMFIVNGNIESKKTTKSRQLKNDAFSDLLVNENALINSSVCIRKSIIDIVGLLSESSDLRGIEDFDYWIRISQKTNRFKYIKKNMGFYRIHDNGVSSNNLKVIERLQNIYNIYMSDLKDPYQKNALRMKSYLIGRLYYRINDYDSSYQFLKISRIHPRIMIKIKSIILLISMRFKKIEK